jgi:hypothetical protein
MAMAIIDLHRHSLPQRPARGPQAGSAGICQAQQWREAVAEVGKTVTVLIVIAIGIVGLRFVLAAAYGLLH